MGAGVEIHWVSSGGPLPLGVPGVTLWPSSMLPPTPHPATRNTVFLASSGYGLAFKCKKEVNTKRE